MFSSKFPKVRQDNLILLVLFQVQTITVDQVIHVVAQTNVMIIEMKIYIPVWRPKMEDNETTHKHTVNLSFGINGNEK